MTLKEMPQKGDKVRYTGEGMSDMTTGNTYVITRVDADGDARYIDDVGDDNCITTYYLGDFELVVEQTPQPVGYVRMNHFSIDSDGHYAITLDADKAGFEAVQRVVIESGKQSDRLKLEIQIAELQRKLEALK